MEQQQQFLLMAFILLKETRWRSMHFPLWNFGSSISSKLLQFDYRKTENNNKLTFLRRKQVHGFMKFFSISFLWGLFRWFYSGGGQCGFSNFPTFGLQAWKQSWVLHFSASLACHSRIIQLCFTWIMEFLQILLWFRHDLHWSRNDLFPSCELVFASWSLAILGDHVAANRSSKRRLVPSNFTRKQYEEP